jgi:hypothetical protein
MRQSGSLIGAHRDAWTGEFPIHGEGVRCPMPLNGAIASFGRFTGPCTSRSIPGRVRNRHGIFRSPSVTRDKSTYIMTTRTRTHDHQKADSHAEIAVENDQRLPDKISRICRPHVSTHVLVARFAIRAAYGAILARDSRTRQLAAISVNLQILREHRTG